VLCEESDGAVEFLGRRSDVADILTASDIACLTSDHEALPLSLLEAAAVGLPLVATDVGGTGEIVQHGKTGYLVAPDDVDGVAAALAKLAIEPAARLEFGACAKALYQERFTSSRMIDSYDALLTCVTQRSSVMN
jgi:glycosyltransferase involved in cell wall biosynthesis